MRVNAANSPNPASTLVSRIHYYWELRIESANFRLSVIPDAAVDIVFSPDVPELCVAYPPSAERWQLDLEGPVRYLGICMPVARLQSNLGHTVQALGCLEVGYETILALDLESIADSIQSGLTLQQFSDLCDNHFLSRSAEDIDGKSKDLHRLQSLIGALSTDQIARIAERWHVSERQLRRLTSDWVGMSPKKIQNVQRLQATLAELLTGSPGTRDDFYDDSHRIRELRRLTGLTPGEIRRMAEKYNAQGD